MKVDTKEYFNLLADKWDEIVWHDEQKLNRIMQIACFKKGDRVLDVGTGTGVMVEYILKWVDKEGEVVGVDISERMIEKAKEKFKHKNNVRFLCSDVLELRITNYFDGIMCYSVFPHFDDQKRAIMQFAKMLKENGKLIICHSQSRKEINNLHKNLPEPINKHFLPEPFTITHWIEEANLVLKDFVDDEHIFLVVAQKLKE